MKLLFFTDAKFIIAPNGEVANDKGSLTNKFCKRYLEHFSELVIIGRGRKGWDISNSHTLTNLKTRTELLPHFDGVVDYVIKKRELKGKLFEIINRYSVLDTVFICRIPSRIGTLAISILKRQNIPYGVEIVSDPYDALRRGNISHPLRPLIRFLSYKTLKKLAWSAPAALYVTQETLQRRYPNRNFSIGVSDVLLEKGMYAPTFKAAIGSSPLRLIAIGSLQKMYKAPDIVLAALSQIKKAGIQFSFCWLGDGKYRSEMERFAKTLDLENEVSFLGNILDRQKLIRMLRDSDLYIHASKTEGLPRSLVEAMAQGLSCIGTSVGGIPELLDSSALVSPGSKDELAEKILQFVEDKELYRLNAQKNWEKARSFAEDKLNAKRKLFFEHLKYSFQGQIS